MNIRTLLLSGGALLLALIAVDGAVSLVSRSEALAGPLDLSEVTSVEVSGDASLIRISTDAGEPATARLSGRREGWSAMWRSGWFFSSDCQPDARIKVEGDRLVVDVGSNRWFGWSDWSDCTVELSANVKSGTAVAIDQQATQTTLTGDFATVMIRSDAGDILLDGHAHGLSISGKALRARAIFRHVTQDETIQLIGSMMDASLRFVPRTPISYVVEATASLVDSALANTPGARPQITVRGEMLRLKIE